MSTSSQPRHDGRPTTVGTEDAADPTTTGPSEDASRAAEPRERPRLKRRPVLLRIVVLLAVLFTGWHVGATFLWIAPSGPARDAVPGDLLSKYMIPFFGQSWSVFAPEPINGDNRMFVRAVLEEDGGKTTVTDWVNVTGVESQLLTHHLFPARAGNQSIDLASDYRSAYQKLSKAQQRTVALNYFKGDDWTTRIITDLGGSEAKHVMPYINADFRAVRYATQVARAVWGDDVVRVQYRMERQNVVPFKERNDPDAQRPDVQLTPSGWRGVQVATGQDDEDFAATFRALYDQYQEKQ